MTKQVKGFIGGAAVVIILLGGYFGAKAYRTKKSAIPQGGYASKEYFPLASLDFNALTALSLPGAGLTLKREGERWEPHPALPGPLNQSEVNAIARSLSVLQAERVIEENPQDLSVYGLDAPAGRILLTAGDGETAEFIGGSMNPSRTAYYVMKAGDPKVYLVSSYSGSGIFADVSRIRNKIVSSSFAVADVSRFLLESPELRIDIRAKSGDDPLLAPFCTHIMDAPYAARRGVSGERFEPLVQGFQNLRVLDFIDPHPADLEPYGLDKPLRAFIETPEETLDLLLGKREEGRRYAQRNGEPEVFTIYDIEPLLTVTPFSLLDKFALIVSIDRVDAVAVRGGGSALTGEIRRQGEETSYFFNGKQVEEKSFKSWYQKAIGVLADAELPNRPQYGGVAEIAIEYRLNNPPETVAAVRFIPYNRDFYALESEGVAEFLVSRSQIRGVYEAAELLKPAD
ncbi:MAG: DUF4340 domain-containing protein [Spirochaetaceae bacterium]|jgi:hypothetical protein|nr:DUF4340 domain-containing protein [Spirochaetaceae bacterium]